MAVLNGMKKKAGTSEVKGFIRSFLGQAGYNSERMQNLGFSYILLPLLKNEDEEKRKKKVLRNLEFFNTHPYMTGALAASVSKMENDDENEEIIRQFRQSMMGPFGALGDSFFWFSLKPLAVLLGVALALAGHYVLAVLAPLVIYNTANVWIRWRLYTGGLKEGARMVLQISKFRFAFINAALGILSAGLIALICVYQIGQKGTEWNIEKFSPVSGILAAAVVFVAAYAVRKGLKPSVLLYLAAGFGLMVKFVGG